MIKSVDIIIPIYNAYEDLVICLDSIYKNTDLNKNRLILINDNSPDPRIKEILDKQIKKNVIVIHNEVNKGFSNNINIGMSQSDDNDVLIQWLLQIGLKRSKNVLIMTVQLVRLHHCQTTLPYVLFLCFAKKTNSQRG